MTIKSRFEYQRSVAAARYDRNDKTTKDIVSVVAAATRPTAALSLVVIVVSVVLTTGFSKDLVEVPAHPAPSIANQNSADHLPVSRISIRARRLVASNPRAAPMRSPERFRPNRSRIAVRDMPSAPAWCRGALR